MSRISADKKFEQAVFAAYRQEGWAVGTLMEAIQNRQYAALRRLIRQKMACDVPSNKYVYANLLAAMDRWKQKGER